MLFPQPEQFMISRILKLFKRIYKKSTSLFFYLRHPRPTLAYQIYQLPKTRVPALQRQAVCSTTTSRWRRQRTRWKGKLTYGNLFNQSRAIFVLPFSLLDHPLIPAATWSNPLAPTCLLVGECPSTTAPRLADLRLGKGSSPGKWHSIETGNTYVAELSFTGTDRAMISS